MAAIELDPQAMIRGGNSIISTVVPGLREASESSAHGVPAGLRPDLRARIAKMRFRSVWISARVLILGLTLKERGIAMNAADDVAPPGAKWILPLWRKPWLLVIPKLPGTRPGSTTPGRTPKNPSPPPGSSPRSVAALQWAEAQNGKWKAPDADAARYSARDWGKGGVGEWSFDCVKFVDSAWFNATGRTADLLRNGNAADIFNSYNADGLVQQGTPPAGAAVFWPDVADGYGHIAIADGNGGVWTTTGSRDGSQGAVTHLNAEQIHFKGRTGWVLPG